MNACQFSNLTTIHSMPDHEDSPGSETLDGSEAEADLSGLSLSDSDTMSDDTAANSLGEEWDEIVLQPWV